MTALLHNLRIVDLSPDSRGIGLVEDAKRAGSRGRIVFVRGALPGQTVTCRVEKDKKTFAEASLVTVEDEPSDFGQDLCPHQSHCGGCPLQRLPYSGQLFWKKKLLFNAMQRIGGLTPQALDALWRDILPSSAIWRYRNKAEFAFGLDEQGKFALGFRKRGSHAILPIQNCGLLPPSACAIMRDCRELTTGKESAFWRFLILRRAMGGTDQWWAILVTQKAGKADQKMVADLGRRLLRQNPSLRCFIHEERRDRGQYARGQRRLSCINKNGDSDPQSAILDHKLAGRFFQADAASFFQINDSGAESLAAMVKNLGGAGQGLLDLYCGCGAPGLLLLDRFEYGLGLEADSRAIECARKNAGAMKFSCLCGDMEKILPRAAAAGNWTTALLDPPRSGLSPLALRKILEIAPKNIIHVSCDPVTMARDAAILQSGYQLETLAAVDMFPHTQHLECCGLWRKTN